jgi:hypothetical protein
MEGGTYQLADMYRRGPYPLADIYRRGPNPLADMDRGVQIRGESKCAVNTTQEYTSLLYSRE